MLSFTTTGVLPALGEIGDIALAHVFKAFGQEAERDIDDTAFLHGFLTVPFVGEEGIYEFHIVFLGVNDGAFAGRHDLLFTLSGHRLRNHHLFHDHLTCRFYDPKYTRYGIYYLRC